ncbi:MAG: hypothetical protein MUF42_06670 [Cytophagaceae bacterium]|jgi:NADH:ubiquinone oxidoreductase subunit 5 (subunit L)/multisubunit Na+/H+ antiporter MnhA subunit|nr:hypothetical protein [Cytophagaceae bacterium]
MDVIINIFILIPLLGYLLQLFLPGDRERWMSAVAVFTLGLQSVSAIVFFVYWLWNGAPTLNIKDLVLFQEIGFEFFIDFLFDKITAVYLFVGSFLTFLITVYSKAYLHREPGYKRFYNSVLLFYLGYNIVIFSGNLETMFIGWEILGVSSFLLIAFYRNRFLPVKNAVKVFTVYRIGDVGILLAMWLSHHFWSENVTFLKLSHDLLVHEHLKNHSVTGVFISLMILLTASAKSAQLPFSSWLPRAMEGPTPSSAIFYGSLSAHIGVFLLLRTFPFWEHQTSVRIVIAMVGLATAIVSASIARVQSSIKSQVAYSSISQIGIIFIEMAAGFENLALFHFAGNSFLRTYQILTSPSVVIYRLREQFYNFIPRIPTIEDALPKRIENTLYMLSLKEWNLDTLLFRMIWKPLKWMGNRLHFLNRSSVFYFFIPAYLGGLLLLYFQHQLPESLHHRLPLFFAGIGLLMVLKSFNERRSASLAFLLIIQNHFWIALAISFNESYSYSQNLWYLSGIMVAGVVGYICLYLLGKKNRHVNLLQFHGHSYRFPGYSNVFLVASLGLTGFPITPTFIGEDLIFSHIHEEQFFLALVVSLSYIVDGLACIRIYARVFLGPHARSQYDMARRSS